MKTKLILMMSAVSLLFMSCAHTNNLQEYNLYGEGMYFEEIIATDASNIEIYYAHEDHHSHWKNSKNGKEEKTSTLEIFKDIAIGIAGIALSADAQDKLSKAANPESIARNVSSGVEGSLVKYLNVRPVRNLDYSSSYIATTLIEECKLVSYTYGIYVEIQGTTKITSRRNGKIVWENSESASVPLRTSVNILTGGFGSSISNITQLAELASLSENEIRDAVNAAAKEAGYMMCETLREDIAKR